VLVLVLVLLLVLVLVVLLLVHHQLMSPHAALVRNVSNSLQRSNSSDKCYQSPCHSQHCCRWPLAVCFSHRC
jgi:hypothetical protein